MKQFLILLMTLSSVAIAKPESELTNFHHETYYMRYEELKFIDNPKRLFLALHNCDQDAEGFINVAQLDKLAKDLEAVIIVPQQSEIYNIWNCWNWSYPNNQTSNEKGETLLLQALVQELQDKYKIDHNNTALIGFGAGAAMAANLIFCFGNLFEAAALHSGLAYKSASNPFFAWISEHTASFHSQNYLNQVAQTCTSNNSKLKTRVLIAHGLTDNVINPKNASQLLQQVQASHDKGSAVQYYEFKDLGHQWATTVDPQFTEKLIRFFDRP